MPDNIPADAPSESPKPGLTTAELAGAGREPDAPAEARSFDQQASPEANKPLFLANDAEALHRRWTDIQAGFVDEPRQAVEQADGLVAETIKKLAEMFAEERAQLERQWDRGGEASTEDLRQALQRYRSFFTRLLAM